MNRLGFQLLFFELSFTHTISQEFDGVDQFLKNPKLDMTPPPGERVTFRLAKGIARSMATFHEREREYLAVAAKIFKRERDREREEGVGVLGECIGEGGP